MEPAPLLEHLTAGTSLTFAYRGQGEDQSALFTLPPGIAERVDQLRGVCEARATP